MSDYLRFLDEVGVTSEQMEFALSKGIDFWPNDSPLVEFRTSDIHGIGMFSREYFGFGQHIIAGMDDDKRWTEAGRFANHSPIPNMCAIPFPGRLGFQFVAYKSICPGEELTVDYRSVRLALQEMRHHE